MTSLQKTIIMLAGLLGYLVGCAVLPDLPDQPEPVPAPLPVPPPAPAPPAPELEQPDPRAPLAAVPEWPAWAVTHNDDGSITLGGILAPRVVQATLIAWHPSHGWYAANTATLTKDGDNVRVEFPERPVSGQVVYLYDEYAAAAPFRLVRVP